MNRILYVTHMFSGLEDLLLNAKDEASGRPSFVKPLIKLIELGYDIDLVVYTKYSAKNINIKNPHFSKLNVYFLYHNKNSILKFVNELVLFVKLYKIIRRENYDFVYTHGAIGIYGCILARMLKIPCGQRLYGTFLYHRLKQNSLKYIAFRYFREYLSFRLPKNFLIMTNDGTKGDVVRRIINRKNNYKFHFLLNGVEKITGDTNQIGMVADSFELFYPARIEEWKQQHLAIQMINELVKRGVYQFKLILAGYIYNMEYYQKLQELVKIYNLEPHVKYIGIVNAGKLKEYYKCSFAVLSFYKYSNLGNVVIEAMSNGALIISLNDGSLSGIIKNNYNGILIKNPKLAAEQIITLSKNPQVTRQIKSNAFYTAKDVFMSWNQRSLLELELIRKEIKNYRYLPPNTLSPQ